MATKKITELTELSVQPASNDVVAIVDIDADVTKKITINNLQKSSFPFTGDAEITGSLKITGSGLTVEGTPGQVVASFSDNGTPASTDGVEMVMTYQNEGVEINSSGHRMAFIGNGGSRLGALQLNQWTDSAGVYLNGYDTEGGPLASSYQRNFIGNALVINKAFTASPATTIHALNVVGPTVITGSNINNLPGLHISASNSSSGVLKLEGSGSTVFEVIGSEGTLFSVDDDLDGTIFTANDRTGLPVLQAEADGEVYLGKTPQSLYTTAVVSATSASSTASLVALSTSSYDSAYFDFTCTSASNSTVGSIMSTWNGATIVFNEHTTSSIGTTYRTAGLDLQVIISSSQAQLVAITDSTSPNTWKVKTTVRAI